MEWITFEDSHHNNSNCYDDESKLLNDAPDSAPGTTKPLIGLHWDTTFKINEPPSIKKPTKPCSVQQHCVYLFKTPIDSFFALIPCVFWEIFCEEINRYATEYLKKKNTWQICGYIWKGVGRFTQLNFMSHFNDNNKEGIAKDSLHKVGDFLKKLQ
jgi:hypothetical protein